MLDGLYLESAGIPAAVVITEAFTAQGSATAEAAGFRAYPLVVIAHPLSSSSEEALQVEAMRAAGDMSAALTESGD